MWNVLFFAVLASLAAIGAEPKDSVPSSCEGVYRDGNIVYMAGVCGVTEPRLVREVKPKYPKRARKKGVKGNVILQAIIQENGSVRDVEVLRCNQEKFGFEEAAIAAVKKWRYEPATRNGVPVDVYFAVFVEFKYKR